MHEVLPDWSTHHHLHSILVKNWNLNLIKSSERNMLKTPQSHRPDISEQSDGKVPEAIISRVKVILLFWNRINKSNDNLSKHI